MNLLIETGAIIGIVLGVIALLIVLLVVIGIAWYISVRNNFVKLRNQYEEAWATIDVYLKKRFDLIPNLVETVKGYAKHENETLTKVIQARNTAQGATTTAEKIEANAQLSQALRNFNVVMEKYPELKANVNFIDLSNQLKSIEGELANSRKYYNATVKAFNTKKDLFPASIVANRMKLEKQPYFEIENPEERQNVKVSF